MYREKETDRRALDFFFYFVFVFLFFFLPEILTSKRYLVNNKVKKNIGNSPLFGNSKTQLIYSRVVKQKTNAKQEPWRQQQLSHGLLDNLEK